MKVSALRRLRDAAGLTQDGLAELAGMSKRSIAAYELGEAQPSLGAAIALADALRVSLDELAGRHHAVDVTPVATASDGSASK
jgi:transcriptional regulator with XRE-family HTH domain